MRYICAQPLNLFFCWQIDVMIHSFKEVGIDETQIDIIFADNPKEVEHLFDLQRKYPNVNFHIYPDTRRDVKYTSSIRPHILKKHFRNHGWMYRGTFLYHDCDIVLTKPLEIEDYVCGCDPTCYLSDTISYIGYDYILSKGRDILDAMLRIANIDEEIVKNNQENSGGAQYLLKDIGFEFWEEVEKDSENLYYTIFKMNNQKKKENPDYHELQIWCADMWAVLWNLWKRDRKTKVIKEMNFTWPCHHINQWNKNALFHNAGVVSDEKNEFQKGYYRSKKPPNNLKINPDLASFKYYELVKKVLNN